MAKNYKILLVAGEASGDAHAAELVKSLREKEPETNFRFFGATGIRMREAGVESVLNADNLLDCRIAGNRAGAADVLERVQNVETMRFG